MEMAEVNPKLRGLRGARYRAQPLENHRLMRAKMRAEGLLGFFLMEELDFEYHAVVQIRQIDRFQGNLNGRRRRLNHHLSVQFFVGRRFLLFG